jgi:hypothetical protein
MARDLTYTEDYSASPIGAIEEQLRQVWNARGAADRGALSLPLEEIEDAMRKLDR